MSASAPSADEQVIIEAFFTAPVLAELEFEVAS